MSDFTQPTVVGKVQLAFPANVKHLMPKMEDIPEEFHRDYHPWAKWQMTWFYSGLQEEDFPGIKEGVDPEVAFNHLSCIQRSFEPKHEHKQAAVAYLASLWFELPPKYREN